MWLLSCVVCFIPALLVFLQILVDLLKIYKNAKIRMEYPTGSLLDHRPYMHGIQLNYMTTPWSGQYMFHQPRVFLGFIGEPYRPDLHKETSTSVKLVKWFTWLEEGQPGPKHCMSAGSSRLTILLNLVASCPFPHFQNLLRNPDGGDGRGAYTGFTP